MDSTLKKVYSMSPEQISACEKKVMLGSGQHGICFREGKGVRLTDVDGNSYIDCTAQGWALLLGHANEEIRQVAYEQKMCIRDRTRRISFIHPAPQGRRKG